MSKRIEEAITEHWGERCEDYNSDCPCCLAWAEYDALNALANEERERRRLYDMATGDQTIGVTIAWRVA